MSGEKEVGPAKYPATFDLQCGYFFGHFFFFVLFFWSHKVRTGH